MEKVYSIILTGLTLLAFSCKKQNDNNHFANTKWSVINANILDTATNVESRYYGDSIHPIGSDFTIWYSDHTYETSRPGGSLSNGKWKEVNGFIEMYDPIPSYDSPFSPFKIEFIDGGKMGFTIVDSAYPTVIARYRLIKLNQ